VKKIIVYGEIDCLLFAFNKDIRSAILLVACFK